MRPKAALVCAVQRAAGQQRDRGLCARAVPGGAGGAAPGGRPARLLPHQDRGDLPLQHVPHQVWHLCPQRSHT